VFDDLDAADIAQSIRQERQVFSGCFLILEGKNDDRALKRHIDDKRCSLQVVGGKPMAIEVLDQLEDEGFQGILCIIDVDYDYLNDDGVRSSSNKISTGVHDLDVAIIASSAFDLYKQERCDSEKLAALESTRGSDLRALIFEAGRPIGCLRLLSAANRRNMALNFSNLDFSSFIDANSLTVDLSKLLWSVLENSRPQTLSSTEIEKRFRIVSGKEHDPRMVCQGHDLIAIVSVALRSTIATLINPHTGRPDPRSWNSEIEMGLRLAFGRQQFEETILYESLIEWEVANPAYQVIKAARS
jgi:hypothetical protein